MSAKQESPTMQLDGVQLERLIEGLKEMTRGSLSVLDLGQFTPEALNNTNSRFFKINSLTYQKDFPKQEAFENVVASINNVPCRLAWYLRGTETGVEFYLGIISNGRRDPHQLNMEDYGSMLERAFKGNFLGSELKKLDSKQSAELTSKLTDPSLEYSALLGVPTKTSKNEDVTFQGIDKLVNIMNAGVGSQDRLFHLLVVWEPVNPQDLSRFERDVKKMYSALSGRSKVSRQSSFQHTDQSGSSTQATASEGSNTSTSHTQGKNSGKSGSSWSNGTSSSDTYGSGDNKSSSVSLGTSKGTSDTVSNSESREEQNKFVTDALKYMDDELLPRLRKGKAKGMFKTAVYVGAETVLNRTLLENALISICQGDQPPFIPLRAQRLQNGTTSSNLIAAMDFRERLEGASYLQILDSRPVTHDWKVGLSTLLTAQEISLLAGLPQQEVPGLELRAQVPFGLNIAAAEIPEESRIELGCMRQEGGDLKYRPVCLDRRELSKHIFIAGVTGSGKTTTCHRLLRSASGGAKPLPFLVIEPAKTEYRALIRDPAFADLLIFTVGSEQGVPFRLNPFEFLQTENLSSHVDVLKACFMASFDMDAAIPNLLEEGLYRAYEVFGWNISTGENRYLEGRREEAWSVQSAGRYFPIMEEYIDIVLKLVDEKGFDDRMRDEYKGSIRARLDSLCAGAKGLMLNTRASVDFNRLLDGHVVLELEELKAGEDKSFLMGLVLGRLLEALKARHRKEPSFGHLTLVEEAHRLLSRFTPGDSPSRKLGVETFADLLAEVRKYGESLIIVDQIPSKLSPEVLKNTNTKIIHKLFARDDKDAVGDTMALDEHQRDYLSLLGPGETVIFSQGWKKPVNVQIRQLEDVSTSDEEVALELVQQHGWRSYLEEPGRFCPGLAKASGADQHFLAKVAVLTDEWLKECLQNVNKSKTFKPVEGRPKPLLPAQTVDTMRELQRILGDAFESYMCSLLTTRRFITRVSFAEKTPAKDFLEHFDAGSVIVHAKLHLSQLQKISFVTSQNTFVPIDTLK